MKTVIGHDHFNDLLTPEEQTADLEHTFAEYDLNKDGEVSEEELNEHALTELEHSVNAGSIDLPGDERLEAATTGEDTEDPYESSAADEPPMLPSGEYDELTEEETEELMGKEEDL